MRSYKVCSISSILDDRICQSNLSHHPVLHDSSSQYEKTPMPKIKKSQRSLITVMRKAGSLCSTLTRGQTSELVAAIMPSLSTNFYHPNSPFLPRLRIDAFSGQDDVGRSQLLARVRPYLQPNKCLLDPSENSSMLSDKSYLTRCNMH